MKEIRMIDYQNEPRNDILYVDCKSFFASVEAVERGQHPLHARIAVVSKPNNQGELVLAASPLVKKEYGVKTGTRVYEIPKYTNIEIVEPQMSLYLKKNIEILRVFKRYTSKDIIQRGFSRQMKIEATDSSKKLKNHILQLFEKYYDYLPVRVVNVTFGKLQSKNALQLNLFEPVDDTVKNEALDQTVDFIRNKYGYTSLLHASSSEE